MFSLPRQDDQVRLPKTIHHSSSGHTRHTDRSQAQDKKRHFQCKECRRVVVSETSLVRKNCQISQLVRKKIADLQIENFTNTSIARQLHISISAVQRKLEEFSFKENFKRLPEVLSIDEFSRNKGQLAFIAQDFDTQKIVTILEDTKQKTIKNYFYQYPLAVREQVKVVTVDMSQSYIPLIKHPRFRVFRLVLKTFSFCNFKNFKTKIFIAFNIRRAKFHLKLSRY